MCLSTIVHNEQISYLFVIVLANMGSKFFRVLVMWVANIWLGFHVLLILCLVKSGLTFSLLDAFAEFLKASIGFIVSIRQSVRPHGISRLRFDGFTLNLIFEYFFFLNICREK